MINHPFARAGVLESMNCGGGVRAPSPSRVGRGPVMTRLNRCTAESHAYSMPGRDAAASLISSPSLVQDLSRGFIGNFY